MQNDAMFQEQVLAGLASLHTKSTHIEVDVARLKLDMEKVTRLTTTIAIAAAAVVVLSPVLQASAPAIGEVLAGLVRP